MNAHEVTKAFEARLCDYTGAPYAVVVDNCSNALFLALKWSKIEGQTIEIPRHTYPAVACEIIHAGGKVAYSTYHAQPEGVLTGCYFLDPTYVVDCALDFTADMYRDRQLQCLSFTGPHKHLKLGKGGAILTDSKEAYEWFKRARFSGRRECSYLEDEIDMLGWNFYMMPEIAARGLQLMDQFYGPEGKKHNEPISLRYPDLSKFKCYGNQ